MTQPPNLIMYCAVLCCAAVAVKALTARTAANGHQQLKIQIMLLPVHGRISGQESSTQVLSDSLRSRKDLIFVLACP